MKKLLPILLTLVVLLLNPTEGWSADLRKGLAAYKSGDYTTALRELKPLADQGNAEAQHNLGLMYKKGQGVLKNYKEAVRWYRLSAAQGHVSALYSLGMMYAFGSGIIKDYVEAYKWANLAATNGNKSGVELRGFVSRNMTPSQIAEAQKLSTECLNNKYKGC
jgi:TPR repeat protein